jgi:hypothetical protein
VPVTAADRLTRTIPISLIWPPGLAVTAASDLWEHHLATLSLGRQYKPPRWLDGMSRRLARARVTVDGKTFAELARIDAGLHTSGPVDTGEWAAWVISMPASGASGTPACP